MDRLDSVRGSLWRLFDSIRNESHSAWRELKRWEFLSPEDNLESQWGRVEALLKHARNHVAYYRTVLDDVGAMTSNGHVSREDFSRIPFLDKNVLRTRSEDLKSDDLGARKWYFNRSGGSTGEPVHHIQDAAYRDFAFATRRLFDEWSGYTVGQPQVLLWGSERDLLIGREKLRHILSRRLRNEVWLNCFRMTSGQMREYIERINSFRPRQIVAYVEAAYEIVGFAEREELQLHSPAAIMTSAGTLHPHMRQAIEEAFAAPVFNRYGSREVGDIACDCPMHQGLHVNMRTHYVEICGPDGTVAPPGVVGEVVVTSLTNYAMPLIRYRIGDMAVWNGRECDCGRGWQTLESVTGRTADVFRRPDGGVVVPEALIHMIGVAHNPGWIGRFQVVQEELDLVRLLISPAAGAPCREEQVKTLAAIRLSLGKIMGSKCKVEIEVVPEIAASPSGKFRYTVSRLS